MKINISRFFAGRTSPSCRWFGIVAVFFALCAAAEPAAGVRLSIVDIGAVNDGKTLNTKAIQKAIDQLAATKEGGTVVIPPGKFLSGAIFLKPGVNLHLEKDAVLLGSTNIEDYPAMPTRIEGHTQVWRPALVNASKCDRLQITGTGTIQGGGKPFWDAFWTRYGADKKTKNLDVDRPRNLFIADSNDILVSGISLRESGFWNFHLYRCQRVTVEKMDIRTPPHSPSTDGIDVDSCQHVDIRGCYISVDDDDIAIKGTKGPLADQDKESPAVEHIRISDCTFALGHGVVTLGSEACHVRDVIVENCKIEGDKNNRNVLVRFKLRPDTPQHYEDIHFRNITVNYQGILVSIEPWTQYFDLKDQAAPAQVVENITISNITGSTSGFGRIAGPGKSMIRNITLENIDIKLKNPTVTIKDVTGLKVTNMKINGVPYGETPKLPEKAQILKSLTLANDYFMKKWPDTGKEIVGRKTWQSHIWTRAVYYEGLMALHKAAPDERYYRYAVQWGESHKWGLPGGAKTRNADNQCCGQTYLELYQIDKQPERLREIKAAIDNMLVGDRVDDWSWIDAIQMSMPVFAKLGVLTGEKQYFEKMHQLYEFTRKSHGGAGLYNPADHLWWRDKDFVAPYKEPNGQDCYWSRGNGWVLAALVRVLEVLPADAPHRDEYLQVFKEMTAALVPLQRADGFWNASLHDPGNYGGKELTGTALFVYGMAWGIRNGHLDRERFAPVVARGWNAMVADGLQPDGRLGYVQGTGKQPKDGQPVTRDSVPDFEDYGLGCFLLAGSEVARLQEDAAAWPEPAAVNRPWAYNWWMGNAVDKENLARELKRYAEAGLGGIHVIPIYGAKGAEKRYLDYLSPQWLEMFGFAVEEGGRLGLGVDLTTGTGWCFGGPAITPELGCRKLVLQHFPFPENGKLPKEVDSAKITRQCVLAIGPDGAKETLTAKIKADGRIDWTPPAAGWTLFVLGHTGTGQKVKRSSPGGGGLMLDPFDAAAMKKYLQDFSAVFDKPGAVKPRAMYHDSYEYFAANWSPDLPEAFAKRRGYRIEDELPAFAGQGDPDRVARVRCDYRETLSDMLVEDVFSQWAGWCRERGMKTRNEAHGSPVNLLDFYTVADIPETEMFGHGGPDPLVSRLDENIGKADRNPLISKFASSAAHAAGQPLASAETGTWLAEHFCESFAEMKGLVDLMFLSGINHVFYHGCVYSPDDAAWPGWLFYASTEMNPRNPLWREAPALNKYIERSQSILQSGRPDNDILLYWPIHEVWAKETPFMFTVHDPRWLEGEPVGVAARTLWNRGYGFDYVSDRLLEKMACNGKKITVAGNSWQTIVVPEARALPPATLTKLLQLAEQGATVIFECLPDDVPGLGNLAARRETLRQQLGKLAFQPAAGDLRTAALGNGRVLAGPLEPALVAAGIRRESLVDSPGLKFIRRLHDQGRHYLVVNHGKDEFNGWLPLATSATSVVAMDALSGETGLLQVQKDPQAGLQVQVRILPGHSLILRTIEKEKVTASPFWFETANGRQVPVPGPWKVEFLSGGPTLPKPYASAEPRLWTETGDPEAQAFSGTAVYRTVFDVADDAIRTYKPGVRLKLGDLRQVARVRLNGIDVGSLIMPPYSLRLPVNSLKPVGNILEVEVTNLGANRLRDLDRRKVNWRIFNDINIVNINYKPFDASNWPIQPSGLTGPVTLQINGH